MNITAKQEKQIRDIIAESLTLILNTEVIENEQLWETLHQEALEESKKFSWKYIAKDLVNNKTGEIFAEAGQEITEELLETFTNEKINNIPILLIDGINSSAFVRNTLAIDKSYDQNSALFEI